MLMVKVYSSDGTSKGITLVHCEAGASVGIRTSPWEYFVLPSREVTAQCKEYPRRVYTGISVLIGPRLCKVTSSINSSLLPCEILRASISIGENSSRSNSHDARLLRSGFTIPMT